MVSDSVVEQLSDTVRVVVNELLHVDVARAGREVLCFHSSVQDVPPDATSCTT